MESGIEQNKRCFVQFLPGRVQGRHSPRLYVYRWRGRSEGWGQPIRLVDQGPRPQGGPAESGGDGAAARERPKRRGPRALTKRPRRGRADQGPPARRSEARSRRQRRRAGEGGTARGRSRAGGRGEHGEGGGRPGREPKRPRRASPRTRPREAGRAAPAGGRGEPGGGCPGGRATGERRADRPRQGAGPGTGPGPGPRQRRGSRSPGGTRAGPPAVAAARARATEGANMREHTADACQPPEGAAGGGTGPPEGPLGPRGRGPGPQPLAGFRWGTHT